jgi:hypothetical protein
MKTLKHMKTYLAVLLLVGLFAGCSSDFLDQPPQDTILDVNFYKTPEQVLAGSAPLYGVVWFAYNDKASHGIGDGRGGVLTSGSYQLENVEFKTTSVTAENLSAWRAFYNIVGQSNTLISNLHKYAGEDVPQNIVEHAIAEARFMRGMAYMFLVENWGEVPIITDNTALLQDTTITRNTVPSIWEFITRDIRYGTTHLPATPILKGRLTKYSAEGMLAKVYLTRAGVGKSGTRDAAFLDSARVLAKDVIENSGASLMKNYEDLFMTKNNNNSETLFALQWVYNGADWGSQNSVQAFLAFGSSITGFADGWGGDIGASLYMLNKYEGLIDNGNTPDARRKATFMFPGDHYSYIHQQVIDPNTGNPVTQELRVPLGGSGYNSRAWVKKYVVGRPEDNEGKVLQQHTENGTYMLRLADIYLIYAEAILGDASSTADGEALKYYNAVRERANVSTKSSITWQDIFDERHLEFAMEGQLWYDFVRLHYYNPQKAYEILSTQDRGFYRITPDKTPDPTKWTIAVDPDDQTRMFPVDDGNFRIPLPSTEVLRAPNLSKTPVPYVFN